MLEGRKTCNLYQSDRPEQGFSIDAGVSTDGIGGRLIGRREGNEIHITDLAVFSQEVTVVSVIRKDCTPGDSVIGIIHSHHEMGTTFSGIDDEFANSNHDLSGVVGFAENSIGLNFNFTCRTRTDCNCFYRHNNLGWSLQYDFQAFDEEEFLETVRDKITETSYIDKPGLELNYQNWLKDYDTSDFPAETSDMPHDTSDLYSRFVCITKVQSGYFIKHDGQYIKIDENDVDFLIAEGEAAEISPNTWLVPDEYFLDFLNDSESNQF